MNKVIKCAYCGKEFMNKKGKNGKFLKSTVCSKECRTKKIERTMMERYGVRVYTQSPEYLEKAQKTTLAKFGVKNASQSSEIKEKKKKTCLKNYGAEHYMQSESGRENMRATCIKNYGVSNPSCVPAIRRRAEITMQKRFGKKLFSKTEAFKEKSYRTKKQNDSFSSSRPEEDINALLVKIFTKVKRQYKSDEYPFACDFYIPSMDLYIEYQGTWTHGRKPFKGTVEDLQKLSIWQERSEKSVFYKGAIKVWTIMDPLKRETAKKNNLNWIEFFNMKEFEEWLEKIQKSINFLQTALVL